MAQTPVPTASWQAGGNLSNSSGFPADTQIAVSEKSVVVTARAVIAFYDKAGAPLQPPIATQSFFSSLNLAASFGIDSYYDTRAIFDPYRKRFWICALTFNSAHQNDTARRDMVVMAVSKTQNPLDGWFLYYWDAVAHYGVPKDPVYKPGDSADYPCLGIDKRCIYQTNAVLNAGVFRYVRVVLYDADTLASGSPNAKGWQFWDLTNPDSSLANIVQPAVHHSESSRAYFAGQFGDLAEGILPGPAVRFTHAADGCAAAAAAAGRILRGPDVHADRLVRQAERFGQHQGDHCPRAGPQILRAAHRLNIAVGMNADGAVRSASGPAPGVERQAQAIDD